MKLVPFKDLTPELQAEARKRLPHAMYFPAERHRFWVTKKGRLAKRRQPIDESVIRWQQLMYDYVKVFTGDTWFSSLAKKAGDIIKYD